jgi:hypothetical protein
MLRFFCPTSHQGPVALLVTLLLLLLLVMLTLLVALLTLLVTHRQDESNNQTGAENLRKANISILPPSTLSKESTEYLSRLQ